MLIQDPKKILQDQVHIFSGTYFSSSQMHQITINYCFEDTNHDVLLKCFISESLQTLSACP